MDELWHLKPIGYMNSVFHYKNGTPRQPAVCSQARGSLTIEKCVFNNPEHSLEGLDKFSHVWIVFLFHKNNNAHSKAKVKPPRLDGKRVGVFSTRSPYRPNAIGLTLAKIDSIKGATVNLSGVDILDGTPILDLKPYIPHYDSPFPHARLGTGCSCVDKGESRVEADGSLVEMKDTWVEADYDTSEGGMRKEKEDEITGVNGNETKTGDTAKVKSASIPVGSAASLIENRLSNCEEDGDRREVTPQGFMTDSHVSASSVSNSFCLKDNLLCSIVSNKESIETPEKDYALFDTINSINRPAVDDVQCTSHSGTESVSGVKTPAWVKGSSVAKLEVTFTPRALDQLGRFSRTSSDPNYELKLFQTVGEVERAISQVLNEDPRSVYRRHKCKDSLYFFSIDTVHVTAWFDNNLAEVLKIQPVSQVSHCST